MRQPDPVSQAELTVATIKMPTASLGPVNRLPMLRPVAEELEVAPDVPADVAARMRTGAPPTLLPHLAQDDYDRELVLQPHRVAVLENDHLRATIALDLGGRLLSLVDTQHDRELLYVNPVVQPANLALRNAWFSGGVEWNIGTRGHSPTTMSTLHAAHVDGPGGEPMLRLWEYERIRGVAFQIDLCLPATAPVLLCSIRIVNLNDEPTPMYWWTNVAVPARPDTRVLAPATRAFRTEYPNRVRVATVPDDGAGDLTYPTRHTDAADFFFDIATQRRPWIASVDGDGHGLAHVSTRELRGRKLFVWGTGAGGQRWQDWLSHGRSEPYAEIQAGLVPTQFEHITMPARAEWGWTEVFGRLAVDPVRSHGDDWGDAVSCVESAIDVLAPAEHVDQWHAEASATAGRAPVAILATGTGWGALERMRRLASGSDWFDDTGTPFPESTLGAEQETWRRLLDTGALPEVPPSEPPPAYVVGADWEHRLARAPRTWQTDYLLGTLAHGRGDVATATPHYETSLRRAANPWATRGLAEAAHADDRPDDAAALAVAAWEMAPHVSALAVEAVSRLLDAGRGSDALALIDALPSGRRTPRMALLEAFAAVAAGVRERAERLLDAGLELPDLREGERSVDQLWGLVFPDRPLPARYDFRMRTVDAQRNASSVP